MKMLRVETVKVTIPGSRDVITATAEKLTLLIQELVSQVNYRDADSRKFVAALEAEFCRTATTLRNCIFNPVQQ
ncbi:MAG: hypothetical protein UY63_C0015G0017 [Parcubacteria group bacterium GW2011_GWA2_51_10]|nr:MAG: hypothetical protein UY63_C0015G0017 [Parcubacteria group bacterium GW2011_GWA2_51_10]